MALQYCNKSRSGDLRIGFQRMNILWSLKIEKHDFVPTIVASRDPSIYSPWCAAALYGAITNKTQNSCKLGLYNHSRDTNYKSCK
jgi:hypothetical protein